MDIGSKSPYDPTPRLSPTSLTPIKRSRSSSNADEHASKKIKTNPEEPAHYSENVRRKLASTSRTGQACDRCKERKMKCDPDPIACQPCRQKSLKCYTTDRVTGLVKERGQSDRAESELLYLKDQLRQYQQRYGPLPSDRPLTTYQTFLSPTLERTSTVPVFYPEYESKQDHRSILPSPQYVGWPCSTESAIYGPVDGTKVDMLEWGIIDTGDFDCDIMRDPADNDFDTLNFSTKSILRSLWHQHRLPEPVLPPITEARADEHVFFTAMGGFIPVVHQPSISDLIQRLYNQPDTVSLPERVQIFQMMAIVAHQTATRNIAHKHRLDQSFQYFHYALSASQVLAQQRTLEAMQALTLILIHFRNLPKPGHTWEYSQKLLAKAMDMDYHRDPDRIDLPPREENVLAKELRKRVFHSILGICVTTGCRIGRPLPWQFANWDVPLPMAVKDSEISVNGLSSQLSGRCDIWPCIQLSKLLPLITELSNYILTVRQSVDKYVKIVEILRNKVEAWRADWDDALDKANEDKNDPYMAVFTLLIDSWVAEFLLNLHHPKVCPMGAPEVMERNLDICHKAAKRLLSNSHKLARKYKACDFTWHSTVAYALGFGVTLHIYKKRLGRVSSEQFDKMKNELAGWINLVAYTDLVMQTNNYFQKKFTPIVKELESQYEKCGKFETNGLESRKSSSSQINSSTSTNGPVIKSESSPPLSVNRTAHPLAIATNTRSLPALQISPHLQAEYNSSIQYSGSTSMPATSCTIYTSATTQYPQFPTSLAPLLNDPNPTNLMHYQTSAVALVQDLTTIFQPQLYTDPTTRAMWPAIAEESFAG